MAARMLRAFTLMTLAAVLVAPSLALDVPALSSACLADRTSGCCPGHIKLLQLVEDGCRTDEITEGLDEATVSSKCAECGAAFNSIAEAYNGESGESCNIVQQQVALFPFACTAAGTSPCVTVVNRVLEHINSPADIDAADLSLVCQDGGCWRRYLTHMRGVGYNAKGAVVGDYKERVGGSGALLACLKVGTEQCLLEWPAFAASLPNVPAVLDDYDAAAGASASFCSGCDRVLLSNAVGIVGETGYSALHNEAARRVILGSCASGCTVDYFNGMVAGKRLYLDTEWKKCAGLYENNNNRVNPVCSTACRGFIEDVRDSFGCCARFALETSALIIMDRDGTNELPGLGAADIPWLISSAADKCGVDLSALETVDGTATCALDFGTGAVIQPSDTFTGVSTITGVDFAQFDEVLEYEAYDSAMHIFRQDLAASIGALAEDITVTGIDAAANTIKWSLRSRSVAATQEAGQAYDSLAGSGGFLLPSFGGLLLGTSTATADATCPDAVIPNYHYIPDVGTVTTDCELFKAVSPTYVDCSAPDVEDDYGNKLWIVSQGLLSGAKACA